MRQTRQSGGLPRWDLSCLYQGPDDERLDSDALTATTMARELSEMSSQEIGRNLAAVLERLIAFRRLSDKIELYVRLVRKTNLDDPRLLAWADDRRRWHCRLAAERITPFRQAVAGLDGWLVDSAATESELVRSHRPWFEIQRYHLAHRGRPETSWSRRKRAAFGPAAWHGFFRERLAARRFPVRLDGQTERLSLSQCQNLINCHPDPAVRAAAHGQMAVGLSGELAELAAQALWVTVGDKAIDDAERGFSDPMSARNEMNGLSDAAVAAMHQSARRLGPELIERHGRLKARLLGLDRLRFSDLNAPVFCRSGPPIDYQVGLTTVLESVERFSPRLADLARSVADRGGIDAEPRPGKISGANNSSAVVEGLGAVSFVMVNWFGQERNLDSLAHETGHAVRALLAGQAQGGLLSTAPVAMSETAALFAEALLFEYRRQLAAGQSDRRERLRLLLGRLDSLLNSTVRQVCLSDFESQLHRVGRRLSADEVTALWLKTAVRFYGPDGQLYRYDDYGPRWSQVLHFHRPFALYGYAFGELLTQGLTAAYRRDGDRFVDRYLKMLAAGQTLRTADLTSPFGFDLESQDFWAEALTSAVEPLLEEAESLAD